MQSPRSQTRSVGLVGATGVGVGAIVGGGVFVLAGVAYAEAGPAATLAFALNAVLAYIAAFSFAELATRFPENGGTYVFAKKVLSVRSAFAAGWVLWFAHIVTAVLYALGFATFASIGLVELLHVLGARAPGWLSGRNFHLLLATVATLGYAISMVRRVSGGGQWANVGKVLVFLFIIVAGIVALVQQPTAETTRALTPFLPGGVTGLVAAMGFTFISLQGVGLIAAIGGEVKEPSRNLPRAMFISLTIAVVLYVPLVFLVSVVGSPGEPIADMAARDPDGAFPAGVRVFLGDLGYWLVIVAALLSTLSALDANMLAGSRVALAMARDRLLPSIFGRLHQERRTPVIAIFGTGLAIFAVLFMVSDLAAAGAAASLIFLVAYVVTHLIAYLLRRREGDVPGAFRSPWFPVLPIAGVVSSGAVAAFQAVRVPDAGGLAIAWLGLGVLLYLALFKSGAETADEHAEAHDPRLGRLRGKNPLVLVPIANPTHARAMVEVANALAPSAYARVLLLTVVPPPETNEGGPLARLADAQRVVQEALEESYAAGHTPIAMVSAAPRWQEIRRIAVEHGCQSLLLGLGSVAPKSDDERPVELENLINDVDADVALLRAPPGWRLAEARRILVPIGGRGEQHGLRARVLGSICRDSDREITVATVRAMDASASELEGVERELQKFARTTHTARTRTEILRSNDPAAALIAAAADHDLIVLGMRNGAWGRREVGGMVLHVARAAPCAALLLGRRQSNFGQAVYEPFRRVAAAVDPRAGINDRPAGATGGAVGDP